MVLFHCLSLPRLKRTLSWTGIAILLLLPNAASLLAQSRSDGNLRAPSSAARRLGNAPRSGPRPKTNQPELATLTATAPNTNTVTGANFQIPVSVGDTTGLGVVSFQFDLVFNPAVIAPQVNPIGTTGTISDGMLPTFNVVGGNTLKVVFFTTTPRVGGGILFFFKFTAVGPAGSSSPLTWVNFMWNEGNPGPSAIPGQVHIVGPTAAGASVSGRLRTGFGQPVANCLVAITDTHGNRLATRSSPFGYFGFNDLPTGETYVLSVQDHSGHFPEQAFTLTGDLTDFDLTADP